MSRLSQEQINSLSRIIPVLSLILVVGGIFHVAISGNGFKKSSPSTAQEQDRGNVVVADEIDINKESTNPPVAISETAIQPDASNQAGNALMPDSGTSDTKTVHPPKSASSAYSKVKEIATPLMSPWGICALNDGVVVADRNSNSLLFFDKNGSLIVSTDKVNEKSEAKLLDPVGLTVWENKVYVADSEHNRIAVFDTAGTYLFAFGKEGKGDGEFTRPVGICCDNKGNIIVVQVDNSCVQVFDSAGKFLQRYGVDHTQMDMLWDIAPLEDGNFVMTSALGGITVFSKDFSPLYSLAERGSGPGSYLFTTGVTTDKEGKVIVCAKTQGKIMIIKKPDKAHKRGVTEGEIYSAGLKASVELSPPVIADAGTHAAVKAVSEYRKKIISYPMDVAVTTSNLIAVAERGNGRILFFKKNSN